MTSPKALRLRRALEWAAKLVDTFGEQALFYGRSLQSIPLAVKLYRRETARLIAEMAFGAGGLLVVRGTVGVTAFLTLASGGVITVPGYSSLGDIGIEALTGFLSAFIKHPHRCVGDRPYRPGGHHRRGHHGTTGCDAHSRRIDALEVMAVRSVSYLVATQDDRRHCRDRPALPLATLASFFSARFTTVYLSGQSRGLYDHYFSTFLIPVDLLWSFLQAIVMSIAVMLVHTYYGYNAKGGPVGVGVATGDAVRTSLIVVVMITLLISLSVYGASGKFTLSG